MYAQALPRAGGRSADFSLTMNAPDLSKNAPRGPRERLGGYVILARAIDKCRADLAGTIGDFHTNCPLDRILFDWKGTDYDAFRALVASGADDAALVAFINGTGIPKTEAAVEEWSAQTERVSLHGDPEKGEWFDSECKAVGLDPETATLFDYLEADDRKSFGA